MSQTKLLTNFYASASLAFACEKGDLSTAQTVIITDTPPPPALDKHTTVKRWHHLLPRFFCSKTRHRYTHTPGLYEKPKDRKKARRKNHQSLEITKTSREEEKEMRCSHRLSSFATISKHVVLKVDPPNCLKSNLLVGPSEMIYLKDPVLCLFT